MNCRRECTVAALERLACRLFAVDIDRHFIAPTQCVVMPFVLFRMEACLDHHFCHAVFVNLRENAVLFGPAKFQANPRAVRRLPEEFL